MDATRPAPLTLVGPPLAPPVELCRWLMQVHGVPYSFRPRAAGLSAFESRRHGQPAELPLILSPEGAVGGLLPSIASLDRRLAPGDTLFPREGDRAFVTDFCTRLFAPAVKSFYAPMLEARDALVPSATAGLPPGDRLAVSWFYGAWRKLMRAGLKLDDFVPVAAETTIFEIFAMVGAQLAGRTYLDGDAPGTRDIVFAVLASPVLLPPGHPAKLPPDEALPAAFRDLVERCRDHPAGRHALKLYRHHRNPRHPSAG